MLNVYRRSSSVAADRQLARGRYQTLDRAILTSQRLTQVCGHTFAACGREAERDLLDGLCSPHFGYLFGGSMTPAGSNPDVTLQAVG